MATHKRIDRICAAAAILSLLLCLLILCHGGQKAEQTAAAYETRLFDTTEVHSIDIVIDDWETFLSTAQSEAYTVCSVVIDGETFSNVGIRGKGNTSLSTVASMDSNRYSFKIEFDQYESGRSYYGLDKLSLNNLIQDATYMKDYLTYQMMDAFGVAAPLCSFVWITVNGTDWGLYLAVEAVEESFLQRSYGSDYGELYKPDGMNMGGGRGNGKDFHMEKFNAARPEPTGDMGQHGMGSDDARLQYIDDDPDSYSTIFSSAKTEVSAADQVRLMESLRQLSCGDADRALDVEAVLRYFVVHNFVVNGDSYTGSMIHNYYLYEKDGRLSMIPWDYNLAFGTFQSFSADSAVNDDIDRPLSVTGNGDRPMIDWIWQNEANTETYHRYFDEFLNTVEILPILDQAAEIIAPYVERDPTAFYTFDAFQTGVETLREFCELRIRSVQNQLSGSEETVEASHLNLSDMGTMNMGGGTPGAPENFDPGTQDFRPPMSGGFSGGQRVAPGMPVENAAGMAVRSDATLLLPISVVVLAGGLLLAALYRRRRP